jgi:hypothetical protein
MTAIFDSLLDRQIQLGRPTTPSAQRLPAITRAWFSLFRFRSPLLTESRLLSPPVGTEMFHFPTFPPLALCVQARVTGHDSCRVSPFGNPRITARLAAPRGFSQPPTSFFGSWCQGIHRAPLLTWPQRCSRPLCSSQGTGGSIPCSSRAVCERAVRRGMVPLPHARLAWSRREGRGEELERPFPQDPTACLGRPSDPASRSCCLRSCTRRLRPEGLPTGQCSTLEHHPRGIRPRRGSGHRTQWAGARCSLERR